MTYPVELKIDVTTWFQIKNLLSREIHTPNRQKLKSAIYLTNTIIPESGFSYIPFYEYLRNMLHIRNIEALKKEWELLLKNLNVHFDADVDLQGVLFLIGIQELGQGVRTYSKSEKQDLMHIATCRLLSTYGFYELEGLDEEGWPHWKSIQQLPRMNLGEQDYLLKQSAIDYFKEQGVFQ